uniref:Uncharacterized protein n=1 Tax=Aegilops tauschii subsp. strangulata TaxID=200361 RepID=A0A453FD49_AEGTS
MLSSSSSHPPSSSPLLLTNFPANFVAASCSFRVDERGSDCSAAGGRSLPRAVGRRPILMRGLLEVHAIGRDAASTSSSKLKAVPALDMMR